MDRVKDYTYGIQFASFYLQGISIPHVRMMETGTESTSLANLFGMPYVLTGDTRSFDTATLNYNWQKDGNAGLFGLFCDHRYVGWRECEDGSQCSAPVPDANGNHPL